LALWFYNTYYSLKGLSGFEYQITITDIKDYFSIYPQPTDIYTVIKVIKGIEGQEAKAKREKDEHKQKQNQKKK